MSKQLRYTFLVHAVVALVLGLPLLLAPGRFLNAIGWAPVEPILGRLLGAATLALAWGSFRGWRATDRSQVAIVVEMDVVYTVLGCIGLLRHLTIAHYPAVVWLTFVVLAAFAVAWIVSLRRP